MRNHIHVLFEIVVLVFNHLVRACGHPGVRDGEESKNWLIKSFQNHMLIETMAQCLLTWPEIYTQVHIKQNTCQFHVMFF